MNSCKSFAGSCNWELNAHFKVKINTNPQISFLLLAQLGDVTLEARSSGDAREVEIALKKPSKLRNLVNHVTSVSILSLMTIDVQ